MTDKIRNLLEDVQTVYEGKGMVVHPNSFDKLRMEVIKLDNINRLQGEQIEKMKCCGNCYYFNSAKNIGIGNLFCDLMLIKKEYCKNKDHWKFLRR